MTQESKSGMRRSLRQRSVRSSWSIGARKNDSRSRAPRDTSTTHPAAPNPGPIYQASIHNPSPLSPTSPTTTQRRPPRPSMEPGSLPIPPAPMVSDLPVDKELLQRWSSTNTPTVPAQSLLPHTANRSAVIQPISDSSHASHRTSAANQQRQPSYPKRHASFDSPREVPLPSPSLSISSLSPGGTLPPSFPPHFSYFSSSGTTPSPSTTASSQTTRQPGPSPRAQDVSSDYFPAQPRAASSSNHKPGQSPTSPPSSGPSSQSRYLSFSPRRNSGGYDGGQYPVFEEVNHNGTEADSDWTSQTSPMKTEDPHGPAGSAAVALGSAGAHGSAANRTQLGTLSSQFDADTAELGPNMNIAAAAMTQMASRPRSQPSAATATTSTRTTTIATPIFPYPRPSSLPCTQLSNSTNPPSKLPTQSPIPEPTTAPKWPDRSSSTSLPLPTQVPFHTLPRAGPTSSTGSVASHDASQIGRTAAGIEKMRIVDREARDAGDAHAERVRQAHKSEVGEHRRMQQRGNYPYIHIPPVDPSSSNSSSCGSPSTDSGSSPTETVPSQPAQRPPSPILRHRRSISPFRAPQPSHRPSTSPSHSSPSSTGTNLSRSQSQTRQYSLSQHTHTRPHPNSPGPAVFAPSAYPAPEPPTILGPTMSPGPFLSHAPPPPDSWIEVETTQGEYRLVVRLPGFQRDGITLAMKRRRILHVVADCWENGGGHFERRISFGYDADLVQVRAEFDGEMLRISIPRRLPPVEIWAPSRQGPVGRLM
ncbi:hypothetical protein D9615_002584 [Tricholomella constricta]|uniref:SHSP domain-containing protein n=1 Tax=Tricholomella constricta TaxID=117010 RepID=A0A8H5HMJ3_9AGAR|nr:hypothetical protein D9615_002584 [Tricholomella constricta]